MTDPTGRYDFHFGEDTVYAAVRDVLLGTVAGPGRVVDLGCGFGALAEPSAAAGLDYVGVDLDQEGLDRLAERGFAARRQDLTDLVGLEHLLDELSGETGLSAVLALDVVEHLPDPEPVLQLLHRLARRLADRGAHSPVLVLSIPNVTHVDVAAKLAVGRWDVTPTGLLDSTHVQLFSSARLDAMLRAAGWGELRRADFRLDPSDQHFPDDLPVLQASTPTADLVRGLRAGADEYAFVNQFVRAYVAGEPEPVEPVRDAGTDDPARPLLTVLVRTRGDRPETLRDLVLCLAAQTCEDFELLLLAHGVADDVRGRLEELVAQAPPGLRARTQLVVLPPGGGRARPLNVGVERARGRWVCAVDDDDVVLSSYVAEFARLAGQAPGRVLRTVVVEQDVHEDRWPDRPGYAASGPFRYAYPPTYDLLAHVTDNFTPFCGLAFPVALFRDLGVRFDETLPVLEDWDLQLRAVQMCGIADSPLPTSVYHRWTRGAASSSTLHAVAVWSQAREQVVDKLDARPLVLPAGAVRRVREQPQISPVRERELLEEIERRGAEMERLAYTAHHHEQQSLHASQRLAVLEARYRLPQRYGARAVRVLRRVDGRLRRPRA